MSALEKLRAAAPVLREDLAGLVAVESPSADLDALARCADVVAELGRRCTGRAPERVVVADRPHLRWRFGDGPVRVVLVGHFDTVWPIGTLARWPFTIDGDRCTGPGVVDMKGGLVVLFHALAAVADLDGVAVVCNSDEEIGSPTSQALIEDTAAGAAGALILEGSSGGKVKIARKGIAHYSLRVAGRASHAGVAPHLGINAGVELAHQVLRVAALGAPPGTTVTPTDSTAGTTSNTVPAAARLSVDVRAFDPAERGRVAAELGLPPLVGEAVGGGSDGNLTAGVGVPTLDGLGVIGGKAHAEGEWSDLASMPERAALVAGLVDAIGR